MQPRAQNSGPAAGRRARRGRLPRLLSLLLPLVAPSLPAAAAATNAPPAAVCDWGFLGARDTDLLGYERLRVLGPFFERRAAVGGRRVVALRPLFSLDRDPARDLRAQEYLWPLGSIRDARGQRSWRFAFLIWGNDYDTADPRSRYRFLVLPFLFLGRDRFGENYCAVFPLGGKLNELLYRDRIVFALFPLYADSTFHGLHTHSILWPIVSRTTSHDDRRFRVFPLYGESFNGELWSKRFVLWPFWTSVRYNYPNSRGDGHVLFPLYGHIKLTDQETWMLLPPLFRWTAAERMRKINCPWPFVQYSSGEIDKLYLWPFWGRKASRDLRSNFVLWPLITSETARRTDYALRRWNVLPIAYYERRRPLPLPPGEREESERPSADDGADAPEAAVGINAQADGAGETDHFPQDGLGEGDDPASLTYFKLWPVASYVREGSAARFRALDLWPLRRTPGIEKNLAPLWTLYSHNSLGGASEDELLWGLFRRRRADGGGGVRWSLFPLLSASRGADRREQREWSLLMGLAGYKRERAVREYRCLYFLRFRRGVKEAPAAQEAPAGVTGSDQ